MRKEVPAEEDVPLEDKVHMNVCKLSIIFVPINFSYLIQFNLRLQKQMLKVMVKLNLLFGMHHLIIHVRTDSLMNRADQALEHLQRVRSGMKWYCHR